MIHVVAADALTDLTEVRYWDDKYYADPTTSNRQVLIAASYKAAMKAGFVESDSIVYADLSCFAMTMVADKFIHRVLCVVGLSCGDFESPFLDKVKAVRKVGNKFGFLRSYDSMLECIVADIMEGPAKIVTPDADATIVARLYTDIGGVP